MSEKTNIQWCDATWNIARGCTKVDADCKFCYMYRDALNGTRYNPQNVVRTKTVFDMPLRYKKTKSEVWDGRPLIFTSSLTDWLHPEIDSYRHEMFKIIRKRQDLNFLLLTKRPERLKELVWPVWRECKNIWLGTSIGSQESISRAWKLLNANRWAPVFFLSLEPLHGPIDLHDAELLHENWRNMLTIGDYIDWVIVGGESGNENGKYRYRPCKLEWIEKIVKQCQETKTPVFVKQLGTHLAKEMGLKDRHGGDINEWPEHLRIRQFPNI